MPSPVDTWRARSHPVAKGGAWLVVLLGAALLAAQPSCQSREDPSRSGDVDLDGGELDLDAAPDEAEAPDEPTDQGDPAADTSDGGDSTDLDTDACAAMQRFDVTFNGINFQDHEGVRLRVVLVLNDTLCDGAEEIQFEDGQVIANGDFSFSWPGAAVRGKRYVIDYFIDLNENGVCDPPPTDLAWRLEFLSGESNIFFVDADRPTQPRACEYFEL